MHSELIIQYVGRIEIIQSMRSLDPTTRSKVAKESINRVCRAINLDHQEQDDKPQQQPKNINDMLHLKPDLLHAGTRVELDITSTHLNVISRETKKIIAQHEMPNVSFASRGEFEFSDYVAYVAKNNRRRFCFVLKCSPGMGKTVLDEIANGFEMRTEQIRTFYNNSTLSKKSPTLSHDSFNSVSTNVFHTSDMNDLNTLDSSYRSNHNITNNDSNNQQHNESFIAQTRESLEREPWFHGSYLSREGSETRLKKDGDFLVRESLLDPGHFVLSVMNEGTKLHLLFDTIGQVRTKEMVFDNISQLISYHHSEQVPIVTEERVVYLVNGVRPPLRSNKLQPL